MKVHCYLGLVNPEKLYADLVERSPWAEDEAAATVDAAVEEEYRLRCEQRSARSGGPAMNGHYEHDGAFYWWEWEPEPEDGELADWPDLTDEVEEGDDDEN